MQEHNHSHEHTYVQDSHKENFRGVEINDYFKNHDGNMEKYLEEVVFADRSNDWLELTPEIASRVLEDPEKHGLSEDEVRSLIIYSTFMYCMNNMNNPEIMHISLIVANELKKAGMELPPSSIFIKSMFNFKNVYRPLYDLLDLATNGRFQGEKMSDDYRMGIIDSIVALRRYERTYGLGDREWDMTENVIKD